MQNYLNVLKKAVEKPPYPTANWGAMDFHNLLEHLKITFDMVFKDIQCYTATEKLPLQQAFLRSDKAMPRNYKTPMLPPHPLPHKFAGVPEAMAQLEKSHARYAKFWQDNPQAIVMHPIFGELGADLWAKFQIKHLNHHFAQFSLEEELNS